MQGVDGPSRSGEIPRHPIVEVSRRKIRKLRVVHDWRRRDGMHHHGGCESPRQDRKLQLQGNQHDMISV
jgi:hypothetical protein